MLLRACKLQAIPISRRVAPSLLRRSFATESTPNASPTLTRDEILQQRLHRYNNTLGRILQTDPNESFDVEPLMLESLSETERESVNEWLADLEQDESFEVEPLALDLLSQSERELANEWLPDQDNVAPTADIAAVSAEAEAPTDVVPAESAGILPADVISGAPSQLRHRSVRVYQATRNTMQSGGAKGERWRIDWDILQGGGRWENPLMGWASSADYMQGTRLTFKSQEDAIHFAKKQGWDYYVQSPTVKRIPPKNYSENYLYRANKLRIAKTK